MAEEVPQIEPKVEEIKIGGSALAPFDEIATRLSDLQMFRVKAEPDRTVVARIESHDIQNRPFLFFIYEFAKDGVTVKYSIGPDTSVRMRRLFVLKNLFGILSLLSDLYKVDDTNIFQTADSVIDDLLGSISQSYSTLFNNYDSLFNEYREIKRMNLELSASNKNLSVQAEQLNTENKELNERLKELETYSDESLMVMIQEWLESHDSSIDVIEFAKAYKLNAPRVEQMLNKMTALGYIELKS
ncbi:MAG: hypothetical protein KGH98_00815 [Candidatus Micrarchaeota archaeon]|nr:hypothetical protein [Candidatus Micrarchaeota archaeon]